MTNPTDLMQLYILLSYEKLRRAKISQHQRPVEGSLRNRLLVWRFLKKIENEPVTSINYPHELLPNNPNLENNNSWIFDFNTDCDTDMDIESDIITLVGDNEIDTTNSSCETMAMDQTSDVSKLLKCVIGAERRQKSSTDNFPFNENNNTHSQNMSETHTFEESEQFFQDLCAELTNTTATLVPSSTNNVFNFSTTPEQTLIH